MDMSIIEENRIKEKVEELWKEAQQFSEMDSTPGILDGESKEYIEFRKHCNEELQKLQKELGY